MSVIVNDCEKYSKQKIPLNFSSTNFENTIEKSQMIIEN